MSDLKSGGSLLGAAVERMVEILAKGEGVVPLKETGDPLPTVPGGYQFEP